VVLRAIADTGVALENWFTTIDERPGAGGWKPRVGTAKYYPDRVTMAAKPSGPLHGETVVFTGALSMDRSEAAQLAASAGCEMSGGITKKSTILVVGEQDARMLNGHDRSFKHRKAEKLIQDGAAIRIMTESNFRLLVGCS
jgi:DNA polymerase-3 subunit epsilon